MTIFEERKTQKHLVLWIKMKVQYFTGWGRVVKRGAKLSLKHTKDEIPPSLSKYSKQLKHEVWIRIRISFRILRPFWTCLKSCLFILHLSSQIWSVRESKGQKAFLNLSSCLPPLPEHLWAVPRVRGKPEEHEINHSLCFLFSPLPTTPPPIPSRPPILSDWSCF